MSLSLRIRLLLTIGWARILIAVAKTHAAVSGTIAAARTIWRCWRGAGSIAEFLARLDAGVREMSSEEAHARAVAWRAKQQRRERR